MDPEIGDEHLIGLKTFRSDNGESTRRVNSRVSYYKR